MDTINSLGRRKEATARVYMNDAAGKESAIIVNGKTHKEYFPQTFLQIAIEAPFKLLELNGKYDVTANIAGGGVKGQAEALQLGISRALVKIDPAYKSALRTAGFITRDPRAVERKKPGRKKARKRFQFSKR